MPLLARYILAGTIFLKERYAPMARDTPSSVTFGASFSTLKGEKPLYSHTQCLPLDGEEMATRDLTRDGTVLRAGSVRIPCYETKRKRSVYGVA